MTQTKRWALAKTTAGVVVALLTGALGWAWLDQEERVISASVKIPDLVASSVAPSAAPRVAKLPPTSTARPASAASGPSATSIEFPAAWPQLLQLETDDQRGARQLRSDPFTAVDNLRDLLERASRQEPEAALRLHDLAEYCDAHRGDAQLPPGYVRLDCSVPRSWTREQRRAWRRQAVFSGDPSPPMSMLQEAEFMAASDPHRADTISDAVLSLDYAARRGCLECILALARVHSDGRLVQQDLRKSFAYLQVAAAATGDSFLSEQAEKIRPGLRPIDIEFARSMQERLAKALESNKVR